MSIEDRFWTKVLLQANDCWLWLAALDTHGYGSFWDGQRNVKANRWLYQKWIGCTEGLVLDHLCRVRRCINPTHQREITHKENILCGEGHAAKNARKTHCQKGHEFSQENTKLDTKGRRSCITCYDNWREVYNAQRRTGVKHRCLAQTHCKRGHEFTYRAKNGWRICKTCQNIRNNARLRKKSLDKLTFVC